MTTEKKQRCASSAFVNDSELRRRRPQEATNKTTRNIKDAAILAAEAVGEDRRGHNGLVGYLKNAAVEEPKAYLQLFGKILPMQNIEVNNQPLRVNDGTMTLEERQHQFKEDLRRMRLGQMPASLEAMIENAKCEKCRSRTPTV